MREVLNRKNNVVFQQYITAYCPLFRVRVHTSSCKILRFLNASLYELQFSFFGSRNEKSVLPSLMKRPVVLPVRVFE